MAAKNQITGSKKALDMSQIIERVKFFWGGLRPQQRLYFGLGLAITVAAVVFFVKMVSTPTYKPLISGLEAADAQTIAGQLSAKKIPYVLGPDGSSISVPANEVDAARLEVASHDSTHSGRIGFEIFDKVSWGQTEFDEKVNYQRALEGELERTIQTISNVKTARVHLVMATDSVFMDRERGAKASVTLRLKHGSLTREDLSAISRLVAGAVDELKPADVTIIDADSNQSLGQAAGDSNDGLERELTRRLIATLSPVVGADHIHASVNVEYENSSSEENQEKYDPAVSATLTMQHSEEVTGPGAGIGGVPGTSSNVPTGKAGVAKSPAANEPAQASKTDNNTYGVNRMTRHVIQPAGSVRRLTAAVVLDDAIERKQEKGKWMETRHKRRPEELQTITELAQAAIGFNSTRGDLISVQNLTFDHADLSQDLPPATFAEKALKEVNDFTSVIRYGVLLALFLLVYLLVIRPFQKRVLAAPAAQQATLKSPPRNEAELPASDPVLNIAQRNLALKKQLTDFVLAEPENSTVAVRAWLREEPS
jgi:flagellar M-ring protein FliF